MEVRNFTRFSLNDEADKSVMASSTQVRAEMTEEKGLDPAAADRIGQFVQLRGGVGHDFSLSSRDLVEQLKADAQLYGNAMAKAGTTPLPTQYCGAVGAFCTVVSAAFYLGCLGGGEGCDDGVGTQDTDSRY